MEARKTRSSRLTWAHAVRNELMMAFFLAFQLRPGDLESLKLIEDVMPDEYKVRVPDYKAKAKVGVIKNFADGAYFADLVPLFEAYLEAREVLLDGRSTPYFFVTEKKGKEVLDGDGYITVGEHFTSQTLHRIIRKDFQDLLPAELIPFTPGMFRHTFTTYLYHEGVPEAFEAQALGHSPQVARQHYAATSRLCDKQVGSYVRLASQQARITRKVAPGKARRNLLKSIMNELPTGSSEAVGKAILELVEAHGRQMRA